MSCLPTILHALATYRSVMLRVSTLRRRAGGELNALRPDLSLRKQIDAWASLQGLVVTWSTDEQFVTFHPTAPLAREPDMETVGQREGETAQP